MNTGTNKLTYHVVLLSPCPTPGQASGVERHEVVMEPKCGCVCEGRRGGDDGVSLEGCIQQLLLRQLLMSEKQQLAGLPEDALPANSQMEGLGLEGRKG